VDNQTLWKNGGSGSPLGALVGLTIIRRVPTRRKEKGNVPGVYFPSRVLRRDGWCDVSRSAGMAATHRHPLAEAKQSHTWPWRLLKHAIASAALDARQGVGVYHDEHEVDLGTKVLPLAGAEWADFDQKGRLVYA